MSINYASGYRCLKIRNVNPDKTKTVLKDLIYQKMEPFHQFLINVVDNRGVGRAAYLNFEYADDAEAAFEQHKTIELFGDICKIVPIYKKTTSEVDKQEFTESRIPSEYNLSDSENEMSDSNNDRISEGSQQSRLHSRNEGEMNNLTTKLLSATKTEVRSTKGDFFKFRPEGSNKNGGEYCANRNLYIGHLDNEVTESELREIFSRYGIVQSIELKHQAGSGPSNNYAFIRFFNMNMAKFAKSKMEGRFIGQWVPRMGYGNMTLTRCIWVGNIGPWTSADRLRSEFSCHGEVVRFFWPENRDFAYIEFSTLNDAKLALRRMMGVMHGKHPLQLDMVDVGLMDSKLNFDVRTYNKRISPPVERGTRHGKELVRKFDRFQSNRDRTSSFKSSFNSFGGKRGRFEARGRDEPRRRDEPRGREKWSPPPSRYVGLRRSRTPPFNSRSTSRISDRYSSDERSSPSSIVRSRKRDAQRSRSHSSSVDRKRPKRSSSPKEPQKNVRTVIRRKPVEFAPVMSNFNGPTPTHFMQNPMYAPRMGCLPLYPPVVNHPTFPPPPIPGRDFYLPPMYPPPYVPQSVGLVTAGVQQMEPATVQQPIFPEEMPPEQHLPSPNTTHKPTKQSSSSAVDNFPKVWSGALVLKNGAFVINLHLVSGSVVLVNKLLGGSKHGSSVDCPVLKIAQRLRLDQPEKLDELDRRLRQAGRGSCSVLLATPAEAEVDDANNLIQQRPLQSLVTYLCQKEVAAVVPLPPGCASNAITSGMLHAFPPCQFARRFLQSEAPGISSDCPAEDQLLVIVCESGLE